MSTNTQEIIHAEISGIRSGLRGFFAITESAERGNVSRNTTVTLACGISSHQSKHKRITKFLHVLKSVGFLNTDWHDDDLILPMMEIEEVPCYLDCKE